MSLKGHATGLGISIVLLALLWLGVWVADRRPPRPDDRRAVDLDRLFRIEELLERHPLLRWRQRAYLDTTFEGTRVLTDKRGFRIVPDQRADLGPDSHPLVVAFGASPDFGYGVEAAEAWPAAVHQRLEADGIGARVINAGEIGYSSIQGTNLFDVVKRLQRIDVAIFSFVVNDVEEIRFFSADGLDDRHSPRPGSARVKVQNALATFAPFVAARRVLLRYAASSIRQDWGREAVRHLATRTAPADYEANLRGLVTRARRAGIVPVFLVLPFRLPEAVPPVPEGVAPLLDAAEAALARGDAGAALHDADAALALDPIHRGAWHVKARALDLLGRADDASAAYGETMRHVIRECVRRAREYNDIMRRVAAETGTTLVDATPLLGGDAADMSLYVPGDYVHPNAAGHARIAEAVSKAVAPLLRRHQAGRLPQESEEAQRVFAAAHAVQ